MVIKRANKYEPELRLIEDNLMKKTEGIKKIINDWAENIDTNCKQNKYTDKVRKNLEKGVLECTQTSIQHNENVKDLEQLTIDLKRLENKEAELMQCIAKVELKFYNLKKSESDKLEAQNQVVQKFRDVCKTSKQLTKTIFDYESSNVIGIIMSHNIQVFNLNPKRLGPDSITKCLWKYMNVASSSSDWSAAFTKKNSNSNS